MTGDIKFTRRQDGGVEKKEGWNSVQTLRYRWVGCRRVQEARWPGGWRGVASQERANELKYSEEDEHDRQKGGEEPPDWRVGTVGKRASIHCNEIKLLNYEKSYESGELNFSNKGIFYLFTILISKCEPDQQCHADI
jgi:hypothetical protein